jgi:hypothetical protein
LFVVRGVDNSEGHGWSEYVAHLTGVVILDVYVQKGADDRTQTGRSDERWMRMLCTVQFVRGRRRAKM